MKKIIARALLLCLCMALPVWMAANQVMRAADLKEKVRVCSGTVVSVEPGLDSEYQDVWRKTISVEGQTIVELDRYEYSVGDSIRVYEYGGRYSTDYGSFTGGFAMIVYTILAGGVGFTAFICLNGLLLPCSPKTRIKRQRNSQEYRELN